MDHKPSPASDSAGQHRPPLLVEISSRTVVLTIAVIAAVWLAFRLTDFMLVVVLAVVLATAIDVPVGWFARHRLPRPFGILAIYAVLMGLVAIVALVIIPVVRLEVRTLRTDLPVYLMEWEDRLSGVTSTGATPVSFAQVSDEASGHLGTLAERLTVVTLEVGRTLVLTLATLVVAFFLASEPTMGSRLLQRFAPPAWRAHVLPIAAAAQHRIGAWARGQALIALIFGLVMGIGLRILGVPFAVSLGLIAAVLEVFPYVGGGITVILASLMALTVGVPQFIGVIVLYLILVNVESHILAPLLFGRAVGLPPIAILLALLAGVELLGVIGALLAVPVTVIIWAIVDEIWPPATAREVSQAPTAMAPPGG